MFLYYFASSPFDDLSLRNENCNNTNSSNNEAAAAPNVPNVPKGTLWLTNQQNNCGSAGVGGARIVERYLHRLFAALDQQGCGWLSALVVEALIGVLVQEEAILITGDKRGYSSAGFKAKEFRRLLRPFIEKRMEPFTAALSASQPLYEPNDPRWTELTVLNRRFIRQKQIQSESNSLPNLDGADPVLHQNARFNFASLMEEIKAENLTRELLRQQFEVRRLQSTIEELQRQYVIDADAQLIATATRERLADLNRPNNLAKSRSAGNVNSVQISVIGHENQKNLTRSKTAVGQQQITTNKNLERYCLELQSEMQRLRQERQQLRRDNATFVEKLSRFGGNFDAVKALLRQSLDKVRHLESETVQIPQLKRELQQLRQITPVEVNKTETHIRFAKKNGHADESPLSDPIEADNSESECIVSDSDFDLGFCELTTSFSDLNPSCVSQGCSPSCRAELMQLKQKISKLSKRLREAERKLHQISFKLGVGTADSATTATTAAIAQQAQQPTALEISTKSEWKHAKKTYI